MNITKNKLSKISVIASIIIVALSLSYYFVLYLPEQNKQEQIKDTVNELLKNKEMCLKYKTDFEKYVLEKENKNSYYYVERVFYSQKYNTCLGAYKGIFMGEKYSNDSDFRKTTGHEWGIIDLLSLEEKYHNFQTDEQYKNDPFIFDNTIKEYE